MSGKWTPGPWEVHHRHGVSDQFDIMPVASRGYGWVTLPDADPAGMGEYMQVGGPCTAATARLISAAPDLVEALENFMGLYDSPVERRRRANDPMYPETISTGRAALAKARGQ